TFAVQCVRMGARHPAHAAEVLVRGTPAPLREIGPCPLALRGRTQAEVRFIDSALPVHGLSKLGAGFKKNRIALIPPGRSVRFVGAGDLVLDKGGMPFVGNDGLPDEPKTPLWIDKQARVGVRETWRIGQQEKLAPGLVTALLAGAEDAHVVCVAFSRAVVPANEQ